MSVLELKMILSARSCTLSSLRLSEALQKCQTFFFNESKPVVLLKLNFKLPNEMLNVKNGSQKGKM